MTPNPKGAMEHNNKLMLEIDKHNRSWNGKKYTYNSKSKALEGKKSGHKQGEREVRSKKAGFYVHGHKNYGDVYEA